MSHLGRINNDHVEQNQSFVNTMVLDFKAMKTDTTDFLRRWKFSAQLRIFPSTVLEATKMQEQLHLIQNDSLPSTGKIEWNVTST